MLDHRLKLELSASTCWNIGAHKIVPFGVRKLRGPADMSVIPDLSLGDTD